MADDTQPSGGTFDTRIDQGQARSARPTTRRSVKSCSASRRRCSGALANDDVTVTPSWVSSASKANKARAMRPDRIEIRPSGLKVKQMFGQARQQSGNYVYDPKTPFLTMVFLAIPIC